MRVRIPDAAGRGDCSGLLLSVMKRRTHRTKLPLVLSIIALIAGAGVLCWFFYSGAKGIAGTEYWFYKLFHS